MESPKKASNKNPTQAQNKTNWEEMHAELKLANRVIERLSMPWDALFREIELSVDEQITLLNVEPDTEKKEIRIIAEAKSLTAMLDYMKRMRTIALFKDAHLLNHQIQQQDPQRPVRFLISANWVNVTQSPSISPAAPAALAPTPL